MRKEEVPQDAGVLGGEHELAYAVDEKGRYLGVQSSGWEPKNVANRLAWRVIEEAVEKTREEVRAGKSSPLAFYMARHQMGVSLLSNYTGFSKRTIKKHLSPEGFQRLTPEEIRRYADLLEISLEEFCEVP